LNISFVGTRRPEETVTASDETDRQTERHDSEVHRRHKDAAYRKGNSAI